MSTQPLWQRATALSFGVDLFDGQHLLPSLVDGAEVGLWVLCDGVPVYANQGLCQLTGHSVDELKRLDLEQLLPGARTAALLQGEAPRTAEELAGQTLLRRDGSERTVQIGAQPLSCGGLSYVALWITDLTQRLTAEQQLRETNRDLEQLVATVSHDLRTPLHIIENFGAELLESNGERLDAEGMQYLERLLGATKRMTTLLDGLLSLARLPRGELHSSPVNLSAMVRSVVADLHALQVTRPVELTVAPDVVAAADPRLLRLVLANLLENAWKYSRDRIPAHITFGVEGSAEQPVYWVRDDGVGFDMATASKLFTPFTRLGNAVGFEGNGIGLATCARAVQRMGGKLWAESKPGEGATFFFTLGRG